MTPALPRPIEPGETLQKGWRVRGCATDWPAPDVNTFMEFTVDYEYDGKVYAANSGPHGASYNRANYDWTLLAEVPTPAPAVGSRWCDDGTDTEYIRSDNREYVRYRGLGGELVLHDGWARDVDAIARLTPIPDHGTGCSPWLWDEETGTAWVAGTDDAYLATHIQVFGRPDRGGYLNSDEYDARLARRLRPWSERGQAK